MNLNKGYLEVILGPMFSGKTTELIRIRNRYKHSNIKCCIINHSLDDRYQEEYHMVSHDQCKVPCIYTTNLQEIMNLMLDNDIILINEGQFFNDVFDIVKKLINKYKKIVYVCGLDGDYKQKKFGQILDLIPISDNVKKLKGICFQCKINDSIFTHRISKEEEQIVVGVDNYSSLCRECFIASSV
ncbi:MAG: hypothetical protein CML42_08190 [Rhodobacteraceae bacterium]|nr:hypothetical protein [Paracoccaceae bacterium]